MAIGSPETAPANGRESLVLPVQSIIDVPGLRPPVLDRNGKIAVDTKTGQALSGNIDSKLSAIEKSVREEHGWFPHLVQAVRNNRRSAIVVVATGSLMILSAVGTGYEFGVRHGEDIRKFYTRLQRIRPPK